MKEQLEADIYCEPFPLMVVNNFYNKFELELIWKELDFSNKSGQDFKNISKNHKCWNFPGLHVLGKWRASQVQPGFQHEIRKSPLHS